jgi:DNA-binding beta-propeller fold protein YncE
MKRALILALGLLALSAGVASAVTGQFSFQGCYSAAAAGCTTPGSGAALDGAGDAAVGPDGKSVYVASGADDSISHLKRDPTTGSLTAQGCFAETNADGCTVPAHAVLDGAQAVVVSPDGKSVYVASRNDDSISHFKRDTSGGPTNGNLTYQGCFADGGTGGCINRQALDGVLEVTVSPDNRSVYVLSDSDSSISHFTRDVSDGASHGNLTPQGCFADNAFDGCTEVDALGSPNEAAVSLDGKSVYVTAGFSDAVSHFTRDTADGASHGDLTYQGCFADTNSFGCAVPASAALDGAEGVTVSPDDKSVYFVSGNDDSISHFTRDTAGGASHGGLTYQSCLADTGTAGCAVPADAALEGATRVAVNPDGSSVYVTADDDDSISYFSRDTANGNLSYQDCFADTNAAGCAVPTPAALLLPGGLALSPDGNSIFVPSGLDDALSVFSLVSEVVPPVTNPPGTTPPPAGPGATGQRAAALKKCKKKKSAKARKKCKKKAKKLPVSAASIS